MKNTVLTLASCAVLAIATSARAQDAIMNSAETINQDNFKFSGYPILLLAEGDNDTGLGLRAGYGFGRGFDIEAKISLFDGLTYYGLDAEWWVHRADPDISLSLGVHRSSFEGGFDIVGIDGTALASYPIAERLELYGGFRAAFEFPEGDGDSFQRLNLVPGIEYRVAKDLDFLAEFGLKLNDNSDNYFAAGLSYYIR